MLIVIVILIALIAFAYIYGKDNAKTLVAWSGVVGGGLVLLIIGIILIAIFWDELQTNSFLQGIVGVVIFVLVIRPGIATLWESYKKSLESSGKENVDVSPSKKSTFDRFVTENPILYLLGLLLILYFFGSWIGIIK